MSLWLFSMLSIFFLLLMGIHNMKRCYFIQWLICLCQVSQCSSYDHILYHQFSFHFLSRVIIWLLQFFANSVVCAHLFNLVFKGCLIVEILFLCSIGFDEKCFVVYFRTFVYFKSRGVSGFRITSLI